MLGLEFGPEAGSARGSGGGRAEEVKTAAPVEVQNKRDAARCCHCVWQMPFPADEFAVGSVGSRGCDLRGGGCGRLGLPTRPIRIV